MDWSKPWLLFFSLPWVMALHHSFPSPGAASAALLLDTCLSDSYACTPAPVPTWGVQETEGQLKWDMERRPTV